MSRIAYQLLLLVILLVIPLTACGNSATLSTTNTAIPTPTATTSADYSKQDNWLALPSVIDKEVDVFFLIPTAWTNSNPYPTICAIDDLL